MSYNFLASRNKLATNSQSGFGLVELMVSISIMVLVTIVILVRQSSFNSAVLLRDQAYDVALEIRSIQMSAVSASGDVGSDFRSKLGLQFSENPSNNDRYIIFRDTPPAVPPANEPKANGVYDSGEEFGLQGILDKRFEIRDIRVIGDPFTGDDLSVIFVRPNFDARFFDGSGGGEIAASSVQIDIARKGIAGAGPGVLRTVEITATGQISVI